MLTRSTVSTIVLPPGKDKNTKPIASTNSASRVRSARGDGLNTVAFEVTALTVTTPAIKVVAISTTPVPLNNPGAAEAVPVIPAILLIVPVAIIKLGDNTALATRPAMFIVIELATTEPLINEVVVIIMPFIAAVLEVTDELISILDELTTA